MWLRGGASSCTQGGACVQPSPCCPQGVKLLSHLYQEALDNCSNEHYPVLLSLLKTSCEPYTRWGPARGRGGAAGVGADRGASAWSDTCCGGEGRVGGLPGQSTAPRGRHACPPHHRPVHPAGSSTTGCIAESSETCTASS